MSILDKLGLQNKKKVKEPVGLNYIQLQQWRKAQQKKRDYEKEERTAKIGALPLKERDCPVCELPMKVAVGQLMFCHKLCKPRYKRALARSR